MDPLTDNCKLTRHYSETYHKYGFNSKGADWGDEAKHRIRLRSMLDVVGLQLLKDGSILDVGCGYGQLYNELDELIDCNKFHYTGLDPCEEVIKHAQSMNKKNADFICSDIQSCEISQSFRTIFNCGVFTKKATMSNSEMYYLVGRFLSLAKSVNAAHICFNTMSPFCSYYSEDLFYPDIRKIARLIFNTYGYSVYDFIMTNSHIKYEMIWRFSV